jgi:hypothetical protein
MILATIVECGWLGLPKRVRFQLRRRLHSGLDLLRLHVQYSWSIKNTREAINDSFTEGRHEGGVTLMAGVALTSRYLGVKYLSTDSTQCTTWGQGDTLPPLGICTDEQDTTASGLYDIYPVNVDLLGAQRFTMLGQNSARGSIAVGGIIYADSGGQVCGTPASGAGNFWQLGIALSAATTQGQRLEFDPRPRSDAYVTF